MVGHRYRQTNDGFTELEGDMRGERWSSADRSQVGSGGGLMETDVVSDVNMFNL